MFTVNAVGKQIMDFTSDFEKEAKAQGLRNPLIAMQRSFRNRCKKKEDGVYVLLDETAEDKEKLPTKQERDNYIITRNEYVAKRCFYEIDYDTFFYKTAFDVYCPEYSVTYLRNFDEFVPCRARDHQCMAFCPRWADCQVNKIWKPD